MEKIVFLYEGKTEESLLLLLDFIMPDTLADIIISKLYKSVLYYTVYYTLYTILYSEYCIKCSVYVKSA